MNKELYKCTVDSLHFIQNYVKVQNPFKGSIPLETYPFQEEFIRTANQGDVITNKARQQGLSTLCAAYALWSSCFHENKNVVVLTYKAMAAQDFMKKVFHAYDNLPAWMTSDMKPTRTSFQLSFQSSSVLAVSGLVPEDMKIDLIIVDEAAYIDSCIVEKMIQQTKDSGGKVILTSTLSRNRCTLFESMWVNEDVNYQKLKFPYWAHPNKNVDWFNKATRYLTKKDITREYLCEV